MVFWQFLKFQIGSRKNLISLGFTMFIINYIHIVFSSFWKNDFNMIFPLGCRALDTRDLLWEMWHSDFKVFMVRSILVHWRVSFWDSLHFFNSLIYLRSFLCIAFQNQAWLVLGKCDLRDCFRINRTISLLWSFHYFVSWPRRAFILLLYRFIVRMRIFKLINFFKSRF